jgi:tRNA threonylcarbamoyladenosine biosynthesis protein TsaE
VWELPDASATCALGAALGRTCPWGTRAPRCIYLRGELGAGKTTLAAALLAAVGVHESVRSPSYALIETYTVHAGTAVHVDLYRLHGPEELEPLGLRDQLQANTLLVLEWPEHGGSALPVPDLTLSLQVTNTGRTALIETFSEPGEAWLALVERECPTASGNV